VLEHLLQHPEDRQMRDFGPEFPNEAQDLNPVALRPLRELTRDGAVPLYLPCLPWRKSCDDPQTRPTDLPSGFRRKAAAPRAP